MLPVSQKSSSCLLCRIFLVTLVCCGLFNSKLHANTIWQSDMGKVEVVSAETSTSNEHPQVFLEEQLVTALREIKGQKKRSVAIWNRGKKLDEVAPLFSSTEAQLLAPFLVEALRQANKDEDVTFLIRHPTSKKVARYLTSSSLLSTSGRVFVRGGKLNIIFGAALNGASAGLDNSQITRRYGSVSTSREVSKPGTRRSKSAIAVRFVESDNVQLADVNGKQRADWLQLAISSNRDGETASLESESQSSIESKLIKLKELLAKELITEEVYNLQLQKLLDEEL